MPHYSHPENTAGKAKYQTKEVAEAPVASMENVLLETAAQAPSRDSKPLLTY
jgi:hypothetical protein